MYIYTSPYQKCNSMWYSEVVGNIIHYIQSWAVNIVLEYIFRLAICAYLPPVLFWCAEVLLIWISKCSFSNYRWTNITCKSCQSWTGCCIHYIHCIQWIKEIVTFRFIFTAQQSVHVDSNDIVAALTTAFGLPGLYEPTIQVNLLLNIDPSTNNTC